MFSNWSTDVHVSESELYDVGKFCLAYLQFAFVWRLCTKDVSHSLVCGCVCVCVCVCECVCVCAGWVASSLDKLHCD